jgi:hypothetical protein
MSARVLQLYVERQKLTLKGGSKALEDDAILAAAGVLDGSEMVVKDLGPQVSWRTVFMTEYVCSFSCVPNLIVGCRDQKNKLGWSARHSSYILLSSQSVVR